MKLFIIVILKSLMIKVICLIDLTALFHRLSHDGHGFSDFDDDFKIL